MYSTCRTFFLGISLLVITQCQTEVSLPPGDPDNGGLFVPEGFEVVVVADSIGSARHMAVSSTGDLYVKLRGGKPKGILALRDTNLDGKADVIEPFGDYEDQGNYGTAMRIYNNYLYFSTAGEVYRMPFKSGALIPDGTIEMILKDDYKNDPHKYEHIAKPVTFDHEGHLYVSFGSPGDVCQVMNRIPGYPGEDPCSQLGEHGGIWQFDANKPGQTQKDGKLYATGIRSVVAMDWSPLDNHLYVAVHGRDNLHATWPHLFTPWQSAVLPSEELLKVKEGDNGGWPYYYYDQIQGKRFLNPEYGGDGKISGKGDEYLQPLHGFPGHWAPNDLFFYTGDQFPERYKKGVFVAFHGSTNRAPYPQAGYFFAFVPFENGKPNGRWEVFADGFLDEEPLANVSDAPYRPMAIAMGPDGSLYLSETVKGKIWRVMFKGNKKSFGEKELAAMEKRKNLPHIRTPHEENDNLDKGKAVGGEQIYKTYCNACHQNNGQGAGERFPPLVNTDWVMGDKKRLIQVLLNGLSGRIEVNGKPFEGSMPSHAFLSDEDMASLLTYVRQEFGQQASPVTAAEVRAERSKITP